MMQIYFLSVLLTALAGFVLASDLLAEKFEGFGVFHEIFSKPAFRLGTAVLTGIVSLISLLYMAPETIPILSDLLPSATGIFMTVTLVYEYMKKKDALKGDTIDDPEMAPLIRYRALTGFFGILVALVHFLVPSAVIL